jgi:phage FluMu protein Com
VDEMVDMEIKCPNCAHQLSVQGKPGDELFITCPKCDTYGKFTFPIDKKDEFVAALAMLVRR